MAFSAERQFGTIKLKWWGHKEEDVTWNENINESNVKIQGFQDENPSFNTIEHDATLDRVLEVATNNLLSEKVCLIVHLHMFVHVSDLSPLGFESGRRPPLSAGENRQIVVECRVGQARGGFAEYF